MDEDRQHEDGAPRAEPEPPERRRPALPGVVELSRGLEDEDEDTASGEPRRSAWPAQEPKDAARDAEPPPAPPAPSSPPAPPGPAAPEPRWGAPASAAPRAAEQPAAGPAEDDWLPGPAARATPSTSFRGLRQVEQYVADGYEIFLVAGVASTGKSELLHAARQGAFLTSFGTSERQRGRALPTPPGTLKTLPFAVGRRKVVLIDAAGEDFVTLYPALRRGGSVGPEQVALLQLMARNLAGLVLLVDLNALWRSSDPESQALHQQQILGWVLELLRWLRHGTPYEPGALSFQEHVDREVRRLDRRLDVPVQVLFSKADELTNAPVPESAAESWMRAPGSAGRQRRLYPLGEDPLLLAWHHLPILRQALSTHVRWYRYDFAHSLTVDTSGAVADETPNGIVYSLGWVMQSHWRWLQRPALRRLVPSSSALVGLQRLLDRLRRRDERWRRLADPRPFGR